MGKKYTGRIALGVILLKLAYILMAFLSGFIAKGADTVLSIFTRNDALWYRQITELWYRVIHSRIELGYHKGDQFLQSEWAFFPFYPWLIRQTNHLLGTGFDQSAFIWSLLFAIGTFVLLFRYLALEYKDGQKAYFTTILWMVFPFHYYFLVNYTEAPFLFFLVAAFYSIRIRKLYLLFIFLPPLVLLRPNGVILLLPLCIYMAEQLRTVSASEGRKFPFMKWILHSLWLLPGALAFIAYLFYQKSMTGFYFAFSIAQAGWYKEFMFPLLALFRQGDAASQVNSVYVIIIMLYAIFIARKIPLSYNILVWISLLLPMTSGSAISMQRYISVIFPLAIMAGRHLYPLKRKNVLLIVLLLLQFGNFYFWLISDKFSY